MRLAFADIFRSSHICNMVRAWRVFGINGFKSSGEANVGRSRVQ